VYDLEKGEVIQIANYKDQCFPDEWSPTSQHVVATCSFSIPYVEGISGPSTVRIFNVKNPDQPYEHIAFTPCYDPSWSPNGKQIALVCDKDEDHKGLFVVSSDGNSIQEIDLGDLGNPVVLKTPIWSPDGSQIVYTAGNEINSQNIYSIQLNNSDNHALTNKNGYYHIIKIYPLP
jgi:Tol biopolymer transport system component